MKHYLHIDIDTSKVVKYTRSPIVSSGHAIAEISADLGEQLANGNIRSIANYCVIRTGADTFVVEPKDTTRQAGNTTASDLIVLTDQDGCDYNVVVDLQARTATVSAQSGYRVPILGTSISTDSDTQVLYVTRRNNPAHLLFCMEVPVAVLRKEHDAQVVYNIPDGLYLFSIYTKFGSTTFSLKVSNGIPPNI